MPRLKGMPTPLQRLIRRALLPLAILAGVLAPTVTATPAHAAIGPVYKGLGWKANTAATVYSLSPEPYVIVFADTTARTKLSRYFTGPAAQVTTAIGVKVTVSTLIDTTPATSCPAYHRIVVHYTYRPMGTIGMSQARPCSRISDNSAWGGTILMDSEYWTHTAWFSTNTTINDGYRKDTATHELGHILGLDHPNTDLNKDGKISSRECVVSTAGRKPVMCSTNRGTAATADAGRFTTEFDLPGLRQMLRNYTLRQT